MEDCVFKTEGGWRKWEGINNFIGGTYKRVQKSTNLYGHEYSEFVLKNAQFIGS